MQRLVLLFKLFCFLLIPTKEYVKLHQPNLSDDKFVTYTSDPQKEEIKLYLKDDNNQHFKSIDKLKAWLGKQKQELIFAMNGGMYTTDNNPLGLYIENYKIVTPLNTQDGYGNFYMKPNGVFFLRGNDKAGIANTKAFKAGPDIRYATQSGPLLIENGVIHQAFKQGSENITVRNGVGILADGRILFVLSKNKVNLYDFASYFKQRGCKYALYLDGFVSRAYCPRQSWLQTDGDFGVIIGISRNKK